MCIRDRNKEDKPIQGVKVSADITPLGDGEELNMVTDSRSATGFRGRFNNPEDGKNTLWFDLGTPKSICRISYIPYTKNYLPKDIDIELWYWDNQWVKGGSLKGDYNFMTFENIPGGTIYRVKVKGTNEMCIRDSRYGGKILENLQAIPSVFMHNLKIRNWFQVGSQSLNCCI